MIVKLPFIGHPCCIPQPIILKVKNPMYLAANEGKTSDFKYFVGGTVTDFEKNFFKSEYIVDIPDSQFVQNVPQLYLKDFDKWSDLVQWFFKNRNRNKQKNDKKDKD